MNHHHQPVSRTKEGPSLQFDIKKTIRKHYEQLYVNEYDNSDYMVSSWINVIIESDVKK